MLLIQGILIRIAQLSADILPGEEAAVFRNAEVHLIKPFSVNDIPAAPSGSLGAGKHAVAVRTFFPHRVGQPIRHAHDIITVTVPFKRLPDHALSDDAGDDFQLALDVLLKEINAPPLTVYSGFSIAFQPYAHVASLPFSASACLYPASTPMMKNPFTARYISRSSGKMPSSICFVYLYLERSSSLSRSSLWNSS